METVELIIKVSITLFNAIALGFVLIMVSRWHRRMEDKLNEIREYTRRVSDRDDVIYMNQLQWLKSKLIEEDSDITLKSLSRTLSLSIVIHFKDGHRLCRLLWRLTTILCLIFLFQCNRHGAMARQRCLRNKLT